MSHSPGPWSYSKAIPYRGFTAQVWDSNGQSLLVMDCITEQANEDAKLIAAAPDMLKALKEAESELFYQLTNKMPAQKAREFPAMIAIAEAIEKATK